MKKFKLLTLKKGVDIDKSANKLINALSSDALKRLHGGYSNSMCDSSSHKSFTN